MHPDSNLGGRGEPFAPVPGFWIVARTHGDAVSDAKHQFRIERLRRRRNPLRVLVKAGGGVATRAHGAKIDRPVSPRTNVTRAHGGLAAKVALAVEPREYARDFFWREHRLPTGIAAGSQVPKVLAKVGLPFLVQHRPGSEGGPELAHAGGGLFTAVAAIGRSLGMVRSVAVRAGSRRGREGWLVGELDAPDKRPQHPPKRLFGGFEGAAEVVEHGFGIPESLAS
jgi:hypothetical protein